MNHILLIDTSGAEALIGLTLDDKLFAVRRSTDAFTHAAFLQPATQELLKAAGLEGKAPTAVAVSYGPGSYTGLRIGLASAKGFCFAWDIPLLLVPTLHLHAHALWLCAQPTEGFIIPMTDARRMEVFFGVYVIETDGPTEIMTASAAELSPSFAAEWLSQGPVYFTGNGMPKWRDCRPDIHAHFLNLPCTAEAFAQLSHRLWMQGQFANLAYAEPLYAKPVYTTLPAKTMHNYPKN